MRRSCQKKHVLMRVMFPDLHPNAKFTGNTEHVKQHKGNAPRKSWTVGN